MGATRTRSSRAGSVPATRYFHELTPDRILGALEAQGFACTGRCLALNSMENRVYDVELESSDARATASERFRVVKFYRPGRWTREQIDEEHRFLGELAAEEIPVVAPLALHGGATVAELPGIGVYYAIFPRARGRLRDEISEDDAARLGRLLARVHSVGARRRAPSRLRLDPATFGRANLEFLLERGSIPRPYVDRYRSLVETVCERSEPWFEAAQFQRIHGDCHLGNVLWGDDGPMLVDFDDMVEGPCVQDVWLLTGGRDAYAKVRRRAMLDAYETMREFDRLSLRLVEPLRALRLVHFSAWIARRWDDAAFPRTFPDFGSDRYWVEQIEALQEAAASEDPFGQED